MLMGSKFARLLGQKFYIEKFPNIHLDSTFLRGRFLAVPWVVSLFYVNSICFRSITYSFLDGFWYNFVEMFTIIQ